MNRIKEFRLKKGFTQTELAAKAGVSRVTIIELENGTRENITIKTLQSIAVALDSNVSDIFF